MLPYRIVGVRRKSLIIRKVSRDSPVLTSLRVLTFLTRAYVRPVIPTHVPLQPLFIPVPNTKILLLHPNVFVSNTHSYAYVAFFNYYPV